MKPQNPFPLSRRAPRTSLWLAVAIALLFIIAITSPIQLPVVLYKVALITLGAVLGYWIDRSLFPYGRPDGYLKRDWRHGTTEPVDAADFPLVPGYERVFASAMTRRAIVVAAVVIGLALGL